MTHDYKVTFTREEQIATIAASWLDAHASERRYITEFVENTLTKRLRKKDRLKIEYFDRTCKYDEPAYVTFRPLTLHVDRAIWYAAKAGDEYARFVIAHEVGHIILHDNDAKAFSSDRSLRIRFAEKEHSAEWQANTFAAYFLLPDELVEKFNDEELLHIFCGTPRTVVRERLASFREARRASIRRFEGDACNRCGNFTIVRDGNRLKCNTCGLVTGALDVVGSV